MDLKIAIVGMAQSKSLAPWGTEWQIWGIGEDPDCLRMNRVFEMHDISELRNYPHWNEYRERLSMVPLYVQRACEELPDAVEFPFAEVEASVGGYWSSSVAYMMSLAIHEGAKEIALFGIDMKAEDEYGYQKPNMEYLIGLARGRGIRVHIPDSSPLCKHAGEFGYIGRYGRVQ